MSVLDQMPTAAAQRFDGSGWALLAGRAGGFLEIDRGFAGSGVEEAVATSGALASADCSEADASEVACLFENLA